MKKIIEKINNEKITQTVYYDDIEEDIEMLFPGEEISFKYITEEGREEHRWYTTSFVIFEIELNKQKKGLVGINLVVSSKSEMSDWEDFYNDIVLYEVEPKTVTTIEYVIKE